ncbi:hypothetical protein ABL78_5562 [Leptomonas seymouri]|uniref:Uncharacterized protein n=1 Tax=Leptomonas seymouri TaxID=5684 RepID=A0A0N1HV03_LEPSE|nr:hypothetical protein ABL78_5562 [Leptomonas seymouri]|eukprot:KPI85381.1 hypothetical protein ABL78_5562 [Leptomonas seymouri]
MDTDIASSEVVPRFVDLALFLCGTALRHLRSELHSADPVSVQLHRWYLHHVCFLHTLPNDEEAEAPCESAAAAEAEREETRQGGLSNDTLFFLASAPPSSASTVGGGSREVSFTSAFKKLHRSPPAAVFPLAASNACSGHAAGTVSANAVGFVHARSASEPLDESSLVEHSRRGPQRCSDVGFSVLEEFLGVAQESGRPSLMRRVAEALIYTLTEHTELPGTPAAAAESAAPAASSSSGPSTVRVATLSKLFEEDLLDDELSMEAGNATRSFHIWVNYEWASASFLRQTRLAGVATQWLRELCRYRDGQRQPPTCVSCDTWQCSKLDRDALRLLPTNLKEMYAALEGVFEGHTNTHRLLMEMSLMQRAPHLTDNALAKLLVVQGPPIAATMSRAELANRGTQPILMSITSGMLLYAQYYLSFHSLSVARHCVRVALQVAQEVPSNSILALAHYTAHVVAVHQGRPADAGNSISIALQLSLGSAAPDGGTGGDGGGTEANGAAAAVTADGQIASVTFAGAAQLLLFFPGAVSAALRSVLYTGRLGSASLTEGDDGGAPTIAQGVVEDPGRQRGSGGGDAVSVQTVAQSIRHAVLRAEISLLHTPPVEGRWVSVVAGLHRETLLLIGALYGIVSTPTAIDETSLKSLLCEVKREAALTSPLFMTQGSRSLFWEVLRHVAHHALSMQEHLLFTETHNHLTGATQALRCLRAALGAIRVHYGGASVETATNNVFFSGVVRYCAACHLQDGGYVTAAHSLFTTVVECLGYAAGMEGHGTTAESRLASVMCDVDAASKTAQQCWPPDHLLLYALAQRRRSETAAFLGLGPALADAQQALLAVSSRYSFSFGVLTAQLMEARAHQHNGRYSAALAIGRRVEHSALRIGYPSLVEAACVLQVTAHSSSGEWRAAQRILQRLQPRHGGHRVSVLLYKFSVHLELLLSEKCVSSHDVKTLTRNWLELMRRETFLSTSCSSVAGEVRTSLAERLCFLSTLTRAHSLLGSNVEALRAETVACLQHLRQRQGVPVSDIYTHGDCEEVCEHSLSCEWPTPQP